jgi:hypothetical protein
MDDMLSMLMNFGERGESYADSDLSDYDALREELGQVDPEFAGPMSDYIDSLEWISMQQAWEMAMAQEAFDEEDDEEETE